MDLRTELPYWVKQTGIKRNYRQLDADLDVHVVIVGAGISGALSAYFLYRDDVKVAIIDKHQVGMGDTATSSASLRYELDTPLHILAERVGRLPAVHAYKLCKKSIYDLQQICKKLKVDVGFGLRPSLQFVSDPRQRHMLYREFGFRLKNGFRVNWLEKKEVEELYGIDSYGGILSEDGGVVNPYALTQNLLEYVQQKDFRIFEKTEATSIQHDGEHILVHTHTGHRIKAKHVVVACGHESINYLPKQVTEAFASYSIATEPLSEGSEWFQQSLIWETGKPYMHLRMTNDRRIIISGKDDAFHGISSRDAKVKKKTEKLMQEFTQRFPKLGAKPEFTWASTYLSATEGLPYIGTVPELPNVYFSVGLGSNGTNFNVLAAQIIRYLIKGKDPKDSEIFAFDR